MKNYLGFGIIFVLFLTSCASVRTFETDYVVDQPYRSAVVYGIYDGDNIKTIRKYTEGLVDKMQDRGIRVALVSKELEKHGLRRNPPILNKEDDTEKKLERAIKEVQAEVLLVTSVRVKGDQFGIQLVAVDAESQEEIWKALSYVSQFFVLRGFNARTGAKYTLDRMRKDGIF